MQKTPILLLLVSMIFTANTFSNSSLFLYLDGGVVRKVSGSQFLGHGLRVALQIQGEAVTRAAATAQSVDQGVHAVDASGITVNQNRIQGSFSVDFNFIENRMRKEIVAKGTYSIDARFTDDGKVSGNFTGNYQDNSSGSSEVSGGVDGMRQSAFTVPSSFDLTAQVGNGLPNLVATAEYWQGSRIAAYNVGLFRIRINGESSITGKLDVGRFEGSRVPAASVERYQTVYGDLYGTDTKSKTYTASIQGGTVSTTGREFKAVLNVDIQSTGLKERDAILVGNWRYEVLGHLIGDRVFGNFEIKGSDNTVFGKGPFVGTVGNAQSMPAPAAMVAPIASASANSSWAKEGYQGPYFGVVPGLSERILSHFRACAHSPHINVFRVPYALSFIGSGGIKSGPNTPHIGYGGVAVGLGLYHSATDQAEKKRGLLIAKNAGRYLLGRHGEFEIPGPYYKTLVPISFWAGMAYLDLFEATQDPMWLLAAKRYTSGLVKNVIGDRGTWTWAAHEGYVGNQPCGKGGYTRKEDCGFQKVLDPGELIYLLGRMRVLGGTDEYLAIEKAAFAYSQKNAVAKLDWIPRMADKIELSKRPDLFSPLMPSYIALYLLSFPHSDVISPTEAVKLAEKIVKVVDQEAVDWSRSQGGTVGPHAFTYKEAEKLPDGPASWLGARLSYIYKLLHEKTSNELYRRKALALAKGVLASQDPNTGLIHYAYETNAPSWELPCPAQDVSNYYNHMGEGGQWLLKVRDMIDSKPLPLIVGGKHNTIKPFNGAHLFHKGNHLFIKALSSSGGENPKSFSILGKSSLE